MVVLPIFKWDTLKEIGPHTLQYENPILGKIFEVELTTGAQVRVWRADDGEGYFCRGLTFGGKESPIGAVSPFGDHVPTILREHYEPIAESQIREGDILFWRGLDENDVVHSAILTNPILTQDGNFLDPSTRVQTKNGIEPEANLALGRLIENYYGESYNAYRRKQD